jgi:lipopolysaccharide assembly outer membrane protein LptD (OstA)
VTAPIVPPYDRVPQLVGAQRAATCRRAGASVEADYTRFESDRALTLQPNASAATRWRRSAGPWQAPGWFVTPKLQLHATNYEFDAPLANGATARPQRAHVQPGQRLVFERDASYFGRAFRQTLEPRAFYVYTPFRDQNSCPTTTRAERLQLRDHLHRERVRRQRPHRRQQPADAGRTTPLLDPTPAPRRRASASRSGCASRTSWSRCRAANR